MPVATTRPLAPSTTNRSRLAALLAAGAAVIGLAACSPDAAVDGQSTEDAYRLGCPALDAAIAGSGSAKDATIKGLEVIRDSGQLDPQPKEWLETAIQGLQASSPKDLPADARKTLVDGCADHGYPLSNLS